MKWGVWVLGCDEGCFWVGNVRGGVVGVVGFGGEGGL